VGPLLFCSISSLLECVFDLICTAARKHDPHSAHDDEEVSENIPRVHILAIQCHALVVVQIVAAADLPQAGQAGGHAQVVFAGGAVVLVEFVAHDGAGADDAHLALHHVPELGQFVEAGLADEATDAGDAGVVLELEVAVPFGAGVGVFFEQFLEHLLGVGHHGAELVALELAAVAAQALVAVDDLLAGGQAHQHGHRQHDHAEQDQYHGDAGEVEGALEQVFQRIQANVVGRPHVASDGLGHVDGGVKVGVGQGSHFGHHEKMRCVRRCGAVQARSC